MLPSVRQSGNNRSSLLLRCQSLTLENRNRIPMHSTGNTVTNIARIANHSSASWRVTAYFSTTTAVVTIGTKNGLKMIEMPKAIRAGIADKKLRVINYFDVSNVLKKFTKSAPCVLALTSLSISRIFPALSMTTVNRLIAPSGADVAPKSMARFRPVSTKSGKFNRFSAENF